MGISHFQDIFTLPPPQHSKLTFPNVSFDFSVKAMKARKINEVGKSHICFHGAVSQYPKTTSNPTSFHATLDDHNI